MWCIMLYFLFRAQYACFRGGMLSLVWNSLLAIRD
uniref:Uncharacterized protein n=1 Tax=Rhizophora mucronata TaxID=61149 RepID=A0A2P2PFL1_RHIMU